MTRLLRITKLKSEDMSTFSDNLEKVLEGLGLDSIGRIGNYHTAGPQFPSTYGFESTGEGGFIVDFDEGKMANSGFSQSSTIETDAIIIPLGATGSLVQRVYDRLEQVGKESGYMVSEMRVNHRF